MPDKRSGRWLASAMSVAVVAFTCAAAVGAQSGPLPAPVTLAGVGGVRIGMGSRQVARLLGAPIVGVDSGDTSVWLYVPICAGAMQGVAGFFGPDSNLSDPSSNGLEWIWFRAGAKTRRGVGTGSTRAEVVRAYGPQLHRDRLGLYLVGQPVEMYPKTFVRPVIFFEIEDGKVTAMAYGARQLVLRYSISAVAFC